MALSSNLTALTREKMMPTLVDNIFKSSVLTMKLLANADKVSGGSQVVIPVEYAKNVSANSKWLAHNGGNANGTDAAFQTDAQTGQSTAEVFKRSTWDWATLAESIVIPGEEPLMNKGDEGVLNVLKARMANAEKSMRDNITSAMFDASPDSYAIASLNGMGQYDGSQTSTLAKVWDNDANNSYINDYSDLTGAGVYYLPEGGVDNTIIGFDRKVGNIDTDGDAGDVNPWWNAYVDSAVWTIGEVAASTTALNADGSDDYANISWDKATATSNGVANIITAFTKMYGKTTINNDSCDLIVTTQCIFDAFASALGAQKRFDGAEDIANAGFQGIRFRNATVVVDHMVPAGQAYFLNSSYLKFVTHKDCDFKLEDFRPMEINYGLQARIFHMTSLVCSAPRMQGLLVGLPISY